MDKLSFTALNAKAERDRIALSWKVDTNLPADSVSFEVVRFNDDDGLVVEEAQEARAHTFTGLKQDTEYVLFVHAYAEPGHSFICEHPDDGVGLAVKTKAESEDDVKPVIPPVEEEPKPVPTSKALQVSDLTSNGFKITWEKEEGKSTRYHAFLKEATEPDSAWRSLINKKNIGSTTAKNLKADTPYVFYVDVFDESNNLVRHDTGEVRTKAVAKKDPWASISKKYPVGSTHKATIRGFTSYAVMAELEEGVLGQIHISELSWDRVENPTDFGAVGDVVDVLILDINETMRKINLSHKELTPKPTATSLLFCLSRTINKDGDHYAALPDVVKPYDSGEKMFVLNDQFGIYLFKTDGKTKEGLFIDSKYIQCAVSDSSVLSVGYGSMHVSVGDGPTAKASAIVFKMLKNGTSSVKIKVLDPNKSGDVLYEKTFTVEVKNPAWDKVTVTGVSLSTSSISLVCGQPFQLKATVSPADASNKAIAWSSEDPSIASVTTDGLVRALKSGTTTIKAVTADGARAALARVKVTSLAFHLCYNKSGGGYASDIAVPSIVRPYADNGKFNVGKKIVVYLYGYCGSDKGHYSINKSYVECTVADPTVLSIEMGTIGGGASPAISFKFLKNGTSDVTIKVKDPMGQRFLIQQTFTVEVNNSAWEKSSTLKATTVTGYYLGFNWEKMDDKSVRYSAYLKESKEKEWRQIMDRCTDTCGIGSGGLKADTQYDFYYEIVDQNGKVLRHEECSVRTSDKVLKVSNVTSNSFTIEWEPLDKAKHAETNYGVYLGGEGPGTAWCRQYKGINSFNYTGLKPGISYIPLVYVYGPDGKEVFTYEAENRVLTPACRNQ